MLVVMLLWEISTGGELIIWGSTFFTNESTEVLTTVSIASRRAAIWGPKGIKSMRHEGSVWTEASFLSTLEWTILSESQLILQILLALDEKDCNT